MTPYPTVTAVCCRAWPVGIGIPIGPCGYCGERPVVDPDRTRWADLRDAITARVNELKETT